MRSLSTYSNGAHRVNKVDGILRKERKMEKCKETILKGINYVKGLAPVKLFIWCIVLVYIIESGGRHSVFGGLQFFMDSPLRFIMNVCLVYTPFTVFFLIRKRAIGYVLVSFAWLAIGITNAVVLSFRVTPFSTIDFRLVDAALGVIGNYFEIWQMILLVILIVAAVAFVVYLVVKSKKFEGEMHYVRNCVLIAAYWFAMYFGMKALVHAGVFSTVLPNLAYAYKDYGVSYCFTVTGMRNGITKPIDYSEEKIDNIKTGIDKPFKSEKENKEGRKANVIFLQLESFFDINYVKDYVFNGNPIPYFTKLKEEYSSGFLTVPAFGAGTANTEFEMMTGMNLGFFSPGEYPYKTILKKRTCESVPYDLASLGYSTHVVHNNVASFYGRSRVFTNLGYDSFTSIETMDSKETTANGWAKDKILTKHIMECLESSKDPDYIYTISVQGHGDYYKESARVEDPEIMVENVREENQKSAVNYYIEQISEMDDFIQELCETLEEYEEDTVLVLYGDHLPGLGFTDEDLVNHDVYQTEYIIWSNFGLEKKDKDLCAYQLAAEVLDRLDIHTGTIMRYHQRYQGKKNYKSKLRALQYDMLYGKQYVYDGINPFQQTDMIFGLKDVVINSIVKKDDYIVVYGSNFTDYSKVFLNGKEQNTEKISTNTLRIPSVELQDGDEFRVRQISAKGNSLRSSEIVYYQENKTLNMGGYNTTSQQDATTQQENSSSSEEDKTTEE